MIAINDADIVDTNGAGDSFVGGKKSVHKTMRSMSANRELLRKCFPTVLTAMSQEFLEGPLTI